MDVTPTNPMFKAMSALTDAMCGEEPDKLSVGPAANKIRDNRRLAMDALHRLVHLSMREGAARATSIETARAPITIAHGRLTYT